MSDRLKGMGQDIMDVIPARREALERFQLGQQTVQQAQFSHQQQVVGCTGQRKDLEKFIAQSFRGCMVYEAGLCSDRFPGLVLQGEAENSRETNCPQHAKRVLLEHGGPRHADTFFADVLLAVEQIDDPFVRTRFKETGHVQRHRVDREIPPSEVRRKIGALEVRKVELKRSSILAAYDAGDLSLFIEKKEAALDAVGKLACDHLRARGHQDVDVPDVRCADQQVANGPSHEIGLPRQERAQFTKHGEH